MTHANHTAGSGRGRRVATSPPNVVEISDCCRYERAASEVAGIGDGHVTVQPNQSCYRLPNMEALCQGLCQLIYTHQVFSGTSSACFWSAFVCVARFRHVLLSILGCPEWAFTCLSTLNHNCRCCICGKLKIVSETHST